MDFLIIVDFLMIMQLFVFYLKKYIQLNVYVINHYYVLINHMYVILTNDVHQFLIKHLNDHHGHVNIQLNFEHIHMVVDLDLNEQYLLVHNVQILV
jgi:hypothetical protein